MNKLLFNVNEEINELTNAVKHMKSKAEEFPRGTLKIGKNQSGNQQFYQRYKDEAKGKIVEKYISKRKQTELISALAQKQYYKELLAVAEWELSLLQNFAERYVPSDKEQIYERYSKTRKDLVDPLYTSVERQVEQWIRRSDPSCDLHPEHLKYETNRGETVRSKSELIIANLLYQYSDTLFYKYESPLSFHSNSVVLYPDFTIIHKKTGKIKYWEHAGMMDQPRYADDFVKKMNLYMREGVLPGRDLILTFESASNVLDIKIVKKLIAEQLLQLHFE